MRENQIILNKLENKIMKINEKSLFLLFILIVWSKSGIIRCNEINELNDAVTKEVNQNKIKTNEEVVEELGVPQNLVVESEEPEGTEEIEIEYITTTLELEKVTMTKPKEEIISSTTHSSTTTTTTTTTIITTTTSIINTSSVSIKKQNVIFDPILNLFIYSEHQPAQESAREPESPPSLNAGSTTQRIMKLIIEDVNSEKPTTTEPLKEDDIFVELSNADIQYVHVTEIPKINETKNDDLGETSIVKDKTTNENENDKKGNNTALIIIIVMSALAIIMIIAALLFYFSRRNYKKVPTSASEDI